MYTNPDEGRAAGRRRYWENPDKYRAKSLRYRDANLETSKARLAAWRLANPEKSKAAQKAWAVKNHDYLRDRTLRRKYGITLVDYNRMLEEQGGVCALCGRPEVKIDIRTGKVFALSVDHDEVTKVVRRLLCDRHNKAIGGLEHSVELMEKVIQYLKRYS